MGYLRPMVALYTQALVGRTAGLEREVALIREVLGGAEHTTSGVRGRRTACGKGARGLFFPQDRYELAGLNDALWARLNEELDITAEMIAAVRGVESQPVAQSVARGCSQQERVTAKERNEQRTETETLKKAIDDVKFRSEYETDQTQKRFVI